MGAMNKQEPLKKVEKLYTSTGNENDRVLPLNVRKALAKKAKEEEKARLAAARSTSGPGSSGAVHTARGILSLFGLAGGKSRRMRRKSLKRKSLKHKTRSRR